MNKYCFMPSQTVITNLATVLDHSVRDNGYIYDDFCNFYLYDKAKLLHIIGGHKRTNGFVIYLAKLY